MTAGEKVDHALQKVAQLDVERLFFSSLIGVGVTMATTVALLLSIWALTSLGVYAAVPLAIFLGTVYFFYNYVIKSSENGRD